MSAQLALPFSRPLTSSAAASPARTCPAPEKAQGSTVPALGSGGSSPALSKRRARAGSSSRTWPAGPDGGCLLCGEPSGHGDMTACPWASRPLRLAPGTVESGSSLLLPTLVTSDGLRPLNRRGAGSIERGGGRRLGDALLPTLTVKGNYNRAGLSATSGDGLITALLPTLCARDYRTGNASATTWSKRTTSPPLSEHLGRSSPGKGCLLDPGWCEAFMGFPEGWTAVDGVPLDGPPPVYESPASRRSGTASSPLRSSRSDG